MKHFQLLDSDGENAGIIKTNLGSELIKKEWEHYYNETETDNLGVEEFIEIMEKKFPNNHFERFFIDELISC
jgi:hypothetical protein